MAAQAALRRILMAGGAALALTACDRDGFDLDLRDEFGPAPFDTTDAVRRNFSARPAPDARGVLSYPNYQVAVAQRGDTVSDVARRVGLPPEDLAAYNGLPRGKGLRRGEIIALPRRVAEPSPATGSPTVGPIVPAAQAQDARRRVAAAAPSSERIDVQTLASDAISRADGTTDPAAAPEPIAPPQVATGEEPRRHKVARGETVYSISRRYDVPVQTLAEWNGLGPDRALREGQYLLIPVAEPAPTPRPAAVTRPGQGSETPTPPSAAEPLPDDASATPGPSEDTPSSPNLASERTEASDARMSYPVQGSIIRAYDKGRNDGIDIAAPAGTPVRAADAGTVAAITRDTDQIPIVVLRHADNLLTVYAGVDNLAVNKGDRVSRGAEIARIRAGEPSFLHFEVREGFDSVDPVPYLE
ncbi:LysM peptidoglycan-binding domain-containing M23 family metallopeptidase [Tranquillimonas alkanivorans]|uniref:Murein DD-endopeptidase MepM and murein hydrolase activator NlpD, contain LysM domain n=1 Tax=Tranquillimonas alkanivorans TaxID=441119 RepID=A0A1I5NEA4_9RHOB|nr:LysM peptidoglycan-binding domain-containing M23 family metallopeptidase [Tranquillimonas alkanivorans]SFP20138.1 Murein DD-endopeptidase MepM and murein hydrolase activator NlpD, contain LysM domain [Tranquillimonas alkanivorans]